MSANQETKFRCDRCLDEIYVPLAGSAPVHARATAPEGWLTFILSSEPGTPPSHLCPPCAFGLKAYMNGASISNVGEPHGEGSASPP